MAGWLGSHAQVRSTPSLLPVTVRHAHAIFRAACKRRPQGGFKSTVARFCAATGLSRERSRRKDLTRLSERLCCRENLFADF